MCFKYNTKENITGGILKQQEQGPQHAIYIQCLMQGLLKRKRKIFVWQH